MLEISFETYLKHEKNCSEHTLVAYRRDLKDLAEFLADQHGISLFEAKQVSKINHRMLRVWMAELLKAEHSRRTVARKLSAAKTFFHFLLTADHIERNPAARVKVPKFDKKLPEFLKESEAESLFTLIEYPAGFEGARDQLILELLYGCGLRRSELIGLKKDNVDLYNKTIKVLGKGNKERILPFGKHVREALENYFGWAEQDGITLKDVLLVRKNGAPLSAGMVYTRVKKYLGQVSSLAQKSPHVLRHSFATHLLDNGADLNAIKELLGHKSLAATQMYTHNSISKLKSVHKQAHPRAIKS